MSVETNDGALLDVFSHNGKEYELREIGGQFYVYDDYGVIGPYPTQHEAKTVGIDLIERIGWL